MFWHGYAKIPRHTSKNAITEGDFKCIFACNCEGTEQLQIISIPSSSIAKNSQKNKKRASNIIQKTGNEKIREKIDENTGE